MNSWNAIQRQADLRFTCNLAEAVKGASVVFIAVGTPPRAGHGDADLSFVTWPRGNWRRC